MRTKTITRLAAAASLTAGLALAMTAPAQARDGAVVKSGSCTMTSGWTLKARPDDGQFEVQAEVDSNVVGQNWQYRITKVQPRTSPGPITTLNHGLVAKGMISTQSPSGSFTLRVLTADDPGVRLVALRATNPETQEVCTGSIAI